MSASSTSPATPNAPLPRIALGTWSWGSGAAGGDQVFGNHLTDDDLKQVFDAAMSQGLRLWDTALVYGMGASERALGALIADVPRQDVIISTKFTPQIAGDGTDPVADELAQSEQNLGTSDIDLYWIHNPGDVERWTPLVAQLAAEGKVGRVGVSNHNLAQIKRVEEILSTRGVHLSAIQNHYSLLYRSSEDAGLLDYCRDNGIDFFAYMTLEQGALSGKYDADHLMPADSQRGRTYNPLLPRLGALLETLRAIAAAHDVAPAQVSVAWAIAKGTIPIIGVTTPAQVDDAAKAVSLTLSADEVARLEEAAQASGVDTRGSWESPMS
ncbi:aldo/keto reductase [Actinomyces sp. ZJ308]|uniref:aldo/keto reductase n=1 Tax=Actinomyces sp. ZJ308 TaxID=2708342 RepID=UPI001AB05870|nr:aldo/keto reductase [Actinomyces sp. ZJ308]